ILRAIIDQRLDFRLDDRHDVPQKGRMSRIDFVADALLKVDCWKLISRGQRDFDITGTVLFDESKFMAGQTPSLFNLGHNRAGHHRRPGRRAGLRLPSARNRHVFSYTLHGVIEVAHEVASAQFAITKDLEAELLLPFEHAKNVL